MQGIADNHSKFQDEQKKHIGYQIIAAEMRRIQKKCCKDQPQESRGKNPRFIFD